MIDRLKGFMPRSGDGADASARFHDPKDYEPTAADAMPRIAKWLGLAVFVVGWLGMRYHLSHLESPDYKIYFRDWYAHLDQVGFRRGFGTAFASYNMPYLYLLWFGTVLDLGPHATVFGIAAAFDLIMAYAIYRLVALMRSRDSGLLAAGLFLVLPSMYFNSAVWGQVDAMYAAFAVLSLDAWMRGRQGASWWWFGVALAMKLQAIFFFPFIVLAFVLNHRRHWLAPLLVLAAPVLAALPAALCGMGFEGLTSAYVGQANSPKFLHKAPNLWILLTGGSDGWRKLVPACMWVAATVLALYGITLLYRHAWHRDPRRIIAMAATTTLLMPWLMPGMRNRYFYLAQVLVLVMAFIDSRQWWVAIVFEVSIFITYPDNLLKVPPVLGSRFWVLGTLVVLVMLIRASLGPVAEDARTGGATALGLADDSAEVLRPAG